MSEPQVFEASEIEFIKCNVCKSSGVAIWKLLQTHLRHGDVTHWDAQCRYCRNKVVILND